MAKWGEGDPRWIVEERPDGTNVNNWHWTEKNATGWSNDKLTSLLKGLRVEDSEYSCEITDVTQIDGEAVANNRKAKLIFFYEWVIKAEWKGSKIGSDEVHKGKLEIPNLSEENEPKDIVVIISANTEKDEALELKEFMRKIGTLRIQEKMEQYIIDLKKEFSQGMILPKSDSTKDLEAKEKTASKNPIKEEISKDVVSPNVNKSFGVKIPCKKIQDKQSFKCRASEIYRALIEKDMVQAFTRNEAVVVPEKGGKFILFGGNVSGEFTNLVPYETISMQWRFKSWPEGHYSNVTLKFEEKEDCTEMTLTQTGVPENQLENTREGWQNYYWKSINQTFGFGAILF